MSVRNLPRRPLDRAIIALRTEYGSDAVAPAWTERDGKADRLEYYCACCPAHSHPPGSRPLKIRERRGEGGTLEFDCKGGCPPSMVLKEVRMLEAKWIGPSPKGSNPAGDANSRILAESFAAIRPERVRWLWDRRIPLGAVTVLVGREKLGKSTLSLELAAQLSRGELPGDLAGVPVDTLVLSYEDSAARTIAPRLRAAGADLGRVHRVGTADAAELVTFPADVEGIARLALQHGARLVIVDPLSASLSEKVNAHRDQDIRRALAPLAKLAEDADLAVLALAHFNKAQGGDALSRVLGSRGLTAGPRSVLAFGRAPDAEEGSPDRVLAHPASNLAQEAPSLAYRIESREVEGEDGEVISSSRLVLVGESETRADDLLSTRSDDERSDRDLAAEWLADVLGDGEWHKSSEVKRRAKAEDIAERTLQRARTQLGIEDRREGYPAASEWRLPAVPPPPGTPGTTGGGTTDETRVITQKTREAGSQLCQPPDVGTTEEPDRSSSASEPEPATGCSRFVHGETDTLAIGASDKGDWAGAGSADALAERVLEVFPGSYELHDGYC